MLKSCKTYRKVLKRIYPYKKKDYSIFNLFPNFILLFNGWSIFINYEFYGVQFSRLIGKLRSIASIKIEPNISAKSH